MHSVCCYIELIALGILENGISLGRFGERAFTTYESNVLYALRFMIDCNGYSAN